MLQFKGTDSWQSLGLKGKERIQVIPNANLTPQSDATLRVNTPIEVDYYRAGGIFRLCCGSC